MNIMKDHDKTDEDYVVKLEEENQELRSLVLPSLRIKLERQITNFIFHDIRNAILKLDYRVHKLVERSPRDHFIRNMIIKLGSDILRITSLIDLLKSNDRNHKQRVFLEEVIYDIVELCRKTRDDVVFKIDYKSLPKFLINRNDINIIFYELISNALRSISEKLQVFTRNADVPTIYIECKLAGKNYELKIEDNGVGIKEEQLPNITDIGYTTEPSRSGIGLAFVKYFVENELNGKLKIHSKKGEGTTVKLIIPEYMNFVN